MAVPPPNRPDTPPPTYTSVLEETAGRAEPPAATGPEAAVGNNRDAHLARRLAELELREAEVARLRGEVARLQGPPVGAPHQDPSSPTAQPVVPPAKLSELQELEQRGPAIVRVTSLPAGTHQDHYKFLRAAKSGDTESVRSGLANGLNPNAVYATGETALILAAREGHRDCLEAILNHPDVNIHCLWQERNALSHAAGVDFETCKLLYDRGVKDSSDGNALSLAAGLEQPYTLNYLLSQQGETYTDLAIGSALCSAAYAGIIGNVETLFKRLPRGYSLRAPLCCSASLEQPHCFNFLLSKLPQDCDLETYMNGELANLEYLLKQLRCGDQLQRLNLLIDRFPSTPFLSKSDYVYSLLIGALSYQDHLCVQKLVDRGLQLSSLSSELSAFVLMVCVEKGPIALLTYFHNEGLDINSRSGDPENLNTKWSTPLHYAATNNKPAAVETLVRLGAVVTLRNSQGDTPIHCAVGKDLNAFSTLANAIGPDLDLKNNAGQTALHIAAKGSSGFVEVLLNLGADATAQDNMGNTPLHYGARKTSGLFIVLSRAPGVNINARNNEGQTPLHISARYKSLSFTRAIVRHPDTDLFATDNNGRTALDIARESGHEEKAAYLEARMRAKVG